MKAVALVAFGVSIGLVVSPALIIWLVKRDEKPARKDWFV